MPMKCLLGTNKNFMIHITSIAKDDFPNKEFCHKNHARKANW